MNIKIPFIEFETDKNCPCKDQSEYELKVKCMKTKLHSRYIACISAGIVIWVLATGKANSPDFANWISFASTITSIILSVIAIIMSITGESKTDAMREQMEETTKKLEATANAIENANKVNKENIKELKENLVLLQAKIESLQGRTDEFFTRYEKDKEMGVYDKTLKKKNDEVIWVRKDDK